MPDLSTYLGAWEGTWSTFLEPNQLYDESPVKAIISHNGAELVIEYVGSIAGDAVTGTIRWFEDDGTTTVDWVDSWHTQGEHERLVGCGGALPSYEYNGDDPWTWDIAIETPDAGVVVTHHNAGPGSGVQRHVGVSMNLETRVR